MSALRFEWDPLKDDANRRKHGVGFDEAATAFSDDRALLVADPDHSDDEDRFVLMGLSAALRVLVVCHCLRQHDTVIRSSPQERPIERNSVNTSGDGNHESQL